MEGVESIPTKSTAESNYPDEQAIYQGPDEYQEPDGIAFHDSFEVTSEFDEDYAEMTAPAQPIQTVNLCKSRIMLLF